MISAFIAALLNPLEVIGAKTVMRKLKINYGAFASINMVFIFLLGVIPLLLFGEISADFFTPKYMTFFAAIILFGFLHNSFYYFALSKEDICDIQPIAMLEPLVSVVLAASIFPAERNWNILILSLVAATALAVSRIQKKKLKFNKYLLAMVGFVICVAIEGIFIKLTLGSINPIALYILRVGFITTFLLMFFRPNLSLFGEKRKLSTLAISTIVIIEFFARYTAIAKIGIVESSLIFMLGPVLVLLFSKFYLKEKYTLRTVIADTVIVICVGLLPFLT